MPVRTLAVWCPDWPVVAAAAAGGVRPHQPVAVLAANRVVACSAPARAHGVRRGLRRREAQGRCPQLVVLAADPDRDARAFEPVVCAVEALVAGVEVIRPGLVVFEARGPARYFGGESNVAERIIDAVAAQTGVECQIGIADGIFAATLAAHRGVTVAPGGTPEFLAPLSVTELCLPDEPIATTGGKRRSSAQGRAELVDLLRRLGLRTLGSFAALPVRDVASRFGTAAVYAHRLAGGADERPVGKRQPPVDLTVTHRFDPPIERVDAVAFAAQQPAAQLHDLLAARGLACTRLQVHAQTDHGEELTRVWRCAEPLTPSGIADRVRWQLDAWLSVGASLGRGRGVSPHEHGSSLACDGRPGAGEPPTGPSAGIVLLRLVPEEVVPVGALQHGLWGETGQGDERAGRAMVRVQGMLGPDAVLTAVPGGGRDPAQRVTLVPWGDELVPAHPPDAPWPGQFPPPFPATIPTTIPATSSTASSTAVPAAIPAPVSTAASASVPVPVPTVPAPVSAAIPAPVPTAVPTAGPAVPAPAPTAVPTAGPAAVPAPVSATISAPVPAVPTAVPAPVSAVPASVPPVTPADCSSTAPAVASTAVLAGAPWVEVLDEDGGRVGVTGRSVLTGTPRRVVLANGSSRDVLAWAGPWPVEERWWDSGGRRRARLQVVLDAAEEGHTALLLACERGRWRVEGVYD